MLGPKVPWHVGENRPLEVLEIVKRLVNVASRCAEDALRARRRLGGGSNENDDDDDNDDDKKRQQPTNITTTATNKY